MSDDPFGELRSLLQTAPSPGRWSRLVALLDAWSDPDDLATRAVPYVASHLRDDPHPRPAPVLWLDELEEDPDGAHPALSLVDALTWRPDPYAEDDTFVRALLGRGVLSRLRHVELAYTPCHPSTMSALGAELGEALDVLKVWNCGGEDYGTSALFDDATLPALRVLDLGGNDVLAPMLERLRGSTRLESLRFAASYIEEEAYEVLTSSSWWPRVRSLDLRHTATCGDVLAHLLSASSPTLDVLKLGGCPLDAFDLASLCDAPFASSLRHLDLGRACHLDESRVMDVYLPFESDDYPHTHDLDPFIERVHTMTSLETLELHQCALDASTVAAFERAEHLRSVRRLDVSINDLGDDGVRALLDTPLCDGLTALDVSFNFTTPELADILANAPALRDLRELSLRGAFLGPIGLRSLSQAPLLGRLESLDLFRNGLDPEGTMTCILAALDPSRVRSLDLSFNPIDDRAARALVDADLGALERLILDRHAFSRRARSALRLRYPFVHFVD